MSHDHAILALRWGATFISLGGTFWLAKKLPNYGWAYPLLLVGSSLWLACALMTNDLPQIVLWAVYSVINCVGAAHWTLAKPEVNPLQPAHDAVVGKLRHEREYSARLLNDMRVEQRLRLKADALNAAMKPLIPILRDVQPIIANLADTYGEGHVLKYGQTESVGLVKRINEALAPWAKTDK